MIYSNNSEEALSALEKSKFADCDEACKDRIYICESCGSDIFCGDDCLFSEEGVFCRRCVMMMTSEDVVELLGHSFVTADKDNFGRDFIE